MDGLLLVKIASIAATAAFGTVGLLKDFRNKKSKRITWAGWVSLAGIALCAAMGIVVEAREARKAERAEKETAEQTLMLAQKADVTLQQVERSLSNLDQMTITTEFRVPCGEKQFQHFCAAVISNARRGHPESPQRVWKNWPHYSPKLRLEYGLLLFRDFARAKGYGEGARYDLGLAGFSTPFSSGMERIQFGEQNESDVTLISILFPKEENVIESNGNIISKADLLNAGVIVDQTSLGGIDLEPISTWANLKDGEEVTLVRNDHKEQFQRITISGAIDYIGKFESQPRDYMATQ